MMRCLKYINRHSRYFHSIKKPVQRRTKMKVTFPTSTTPSTSSLSVILNSKLPFKHCTVTKPDTPFVVDAPWNINYQQQVIKERDNL